MDSRESVFTQFARDLNKFTEHKLTKKDLYERFVSYIEMCNEQEKFERINYQAEMGEYMKLDTTDMLTTKPPTCTYKLEKNMLE